MNADIQRGDHWRVVLQGSPTFLDKAMELPSATWEIKKEGDSYILLSPELEKYDQEHENEVWIEAGAIITRIESAVILQHVYPGQITRARVIRVRANGTATTSLAVEASAALSGTRTYQTPEGTRHIAEVLEALRHEETVNEALHHFRRTDIHWALRARHVFEIIRDDVATATGSKTCKALGPNGVNWIADDDFDRFWTALHNPKVPGALHVRPGSIRRTGNHKDPMSRGEVDEFIRHLLETWVRWRLARQSEPQPDTGA